MKSTNVKRLTLPEYIEQYGPDLLGRIVEYEDPINIEVFPTYPDNRTSLLPVAVLKEAGRFQKVTGGFGANLMSNGRMITGPFYLVLEAALADDPISLTKENLPVASFLKKAKEEDNELMISLLEEATGLTSAESTKRLPSWVIIPMEDDDE